MPQATQNTVSGGNIFSVQQMTTWQCKEVGDGMEAYRPSKQLFDAFFDLASTSDLPPGIGVFSNYDLETNIVTWYFTPEASTLAEAFGATPCVKPVPVEGFGLLVGSQDSWQIHFPDYLSKRTHREF